MFFIEGLKKAFVQFVIYTVRIYLRVGYFPKITFTPNAPKTRRFKTPSIIIANHTSMIDPIMMLALFFHHTSIVVAKDQVESKEFHWALSRTKRVIPCDRFNLDTEWALLAKKQLEKGNSVIIFPEGKCRTDGLFNEFKSGFAFLARSTGAPVVSVGLEGVYKLGHRTRVIIDAPEKIERVKGVSSSKHLAERSEYFRQKIWNLKATVLGKIPVELPAPENTPEEIVK